MDRALAVARALAIALGAVVAVLMVHALHDGLVKEHPALGVDHVLFGIALATALMPGPILAWWVKPSSGDRLRGVCFGGCVVTAFVALLGGAFLWHSLVDKGEGGTAAGLSLGWCLLVIPVCVFDGVRARWGPRPEAEDEATDDGAAVTDTASK